MVCWAQSGLIPLLKANYGYGSDWILISPMATYGFPINLHITSSSTNHFLIWGCRRIKRQNVQSWVLFHHSEFVLCTRTMLSETVIISRTFMSRLTSVLFVKDQQMLSHVRGEGYKYYTRITTTNKVYLK